MHHPREANNSIYDSGLGSREHHGSIVAVHISSVILFHKPRQWRCIYIPYLPSSILDTLHASVPYIIGVHSNQKENVLTQFDCLDKVLVDLDQDRVIGCNLVI